MADEIGMVEKVARAIYESRYGSGGLGGSGWINPFLPESERQKYRNYARAAISVFADFLRQRASEGGTIHAIDVEKTIRIAALSEDKP